MRGRKRTNTVGTRGRAKEVIGPAPDPNNGSAAAAVIVVATPEEPILQAHQAQSLESMPLVTESPLSLSSSVSLEKIPNELVPAVTPRRRTSSRKPTQPTYIPREDTKKVIAGKLEKCAAWASVAEDEKENIVRRLERACYNCVIDQCSELYIEKSWDQSGFVNRYGAIVYKLLSNIDLSREYQAAAGLKSVEVKSGEVVSSEVMSSEMLSGEVTLRDSASLGDKIIRGEINIATAPLMSSYEMFPEATQKERDILEFRAGQKVQKKFTTRYGCPKCGQHKAEPKEVQTSANDEISVFNLLCLVCGHTWFQK